MAPAPRIRRPLALELTLLAGVLSVVPIVGVGAYVIDVNEGALAEGALELQGAVIDDVSRSLDAQLVDAEDALESVGRVLTDPTLAEGDTVPIARAIVEGRSAIDHVGIYAADGARIDTLSEAGREAPLPDALEPALRERASRDGATTGALSRGPRVLVVVPLRARDAVTGYAATRLSLEPLADRVDSLAALRFPGVDEPLFVVDREGRLVAHPDRERADALEAYADRGPLAGVDLAQEASFAGRFTAADGTRWIGTVQPVGARPFRIVAQIPESVALASIFEVRLAVRVAAGVAIVLSFLVGVLFARRITRPMGELVELAKALAARRFGARVEVRSANELALLGHAMSEASLELEASEARIRREEAIRHDLGRYLPPQIVERVVAREQDMALGGSRRTITVLFADVVAFTPLTERLPPEKVVEILNELFTILTEIVFRHGGTVDKFIGDSVMALFGAPGDQPDHAERALACAEDMLRWLDTGNAAWREAHGLTIQLAIGVSTGDCVVGNVGSERRMEYTAIGDVVNVAARLEAIARPSQILCTRATKDAAGDAFEMLDAGERELAGRAEKVHVYEVAQ